MCILVAEATANKVKRLKTCNTLNYKDLKTLNMAYMDRIEWE